MLGLEPRFLKRSLAAALLAALTHDAAIAAPVDYDGAAGELTIDSLAVYSGGALAGTYKATLRLVGTTPLEFELDTLERTEPHGGNHAVWHTEGDTLVVPGVTVNGKLDYAVQLRRQGGAESQRFVVTDTQLLRDGRYFNRIATFPAFLNGDIEDATAAEIVDVSADGNTLVYTDAVGGRVGFVDITDPAAPQPLGFIETEGGTATSVAVVGDYVLAAIDTSQSFTDPSGELLIIDLDSHAMLARMDLGGQPDSVAVSPDKRYAAVVIENQRDEDLGDGAPPQLPSGSLQIIDLVGDPADWSMRNVPMAGIAELYPDDAEPEFVDINSDNVAVVTLQENNHIVLIDLESGEITRDFSAGSVNLTQVDTQAESPALINPVDTLLDVLREPDGVAWIGTDVFATANEGDLDGGSRGFTVFDTQGNVVLDAGSSLEHAVIRAGHHNDDRSDAKGAEPENIEYAKIGDEEWLFVAAERASVIVAYNLTRLTMQILPSGMGPEGLKAVPSRGLLIAATEEDAREDLVRGGLVIYQLQSGAPRYPLISSRNRLDGVAMPWGALSGLAAGRADHNTVYTVADSFYQRSRIYTMDIAGHPALLTHEVELKDSMGLLAEEAPGMVNADGSVNLDLEGISTSADGGFWLASEGDGSAAEPVSRNLLLHVARDGAIDDVVTLPAGTESRQVRFGYEGVAAVGDAGSETVYVAFQREWANDPARRVRIGRYQQSSGQWSFFYYPIDAVASPNGGWVGLSEITAISDTDFAVIERDNQGNMDARIKRLYRFSVDGLAPQAEAASGATPTFPVVEKELVLDLLPQMQATGGLVVEKIEGMTITSSGETLVVSDNDGVDGSNGETQLFRIPGLPY